MKNNVKETNKKVIVGVSVGAAVLVLVIILAIVFGGKIISSFKNGSDNEKNPQKDSASQSEQITDNGDKGTESGSGNQNQNQNVTPKDTGNSKVEVKNVEANITDKQITVPIYATKNDGMTAAKLVLDFDTDAFEYADCKAGDIFSNCQGNFKDGKIIIVAQSGANESDVKGAGVITNVVLVPKKGAAAGDYEIKVSKESEFANWDAQFVTPTVEVGKITLK